MSSKNSSSDNSDGFDELEALFFQEGEQQEKDSKEELRMLSDEFEDEDFATADISIDDISLDQLYMPVDKPTNDPPIPTELTNLKSEANVQNYSEVEVINEHPDVESEAEEVNVAVEESVSATEESTSVESQLGDTLDDFNEALLPETSVEVPEVSTEFKGEATSTLNLYVPSSPVKAVQDLVQCFINEAEAQTDSESKGALFSEAAKLAYRILRDKNLAYEVFNKADNSSILQADSLRLFADVSAKVGEHSMSSELLERWARSLKGKLVADALLDTALYENGVLKRKHRGISLLQQALDVNPQQWSVLQPLAHFLEDIEDWDELIITYQKMASLSSGFIAANFHNETGYIQEFYLEKHRDAAHSYQMALDVDPHDTDAFMSYERIMRHLGQVEDRIGLYEQQSKIDVDGKSVWVRRAAYLSIYTGGYERASQMLSDESPSYLRAVLYKKNEKKNLYQKELKFLIEKFSGSKKAYAAWQLAQSYLEEDNFKKALDAFILGASVNANLFPFAEEITNILLDNADYDKTSEYISSQIELVGEDKPLITLIWEAYLLKAAVQNNREGDFLSRSQSTVFRHLNTLLLLQEKRWKEAFDLFCAMAENRASPSYYVLAANIAEYKLNDPVVAKKCYESAKLFLKESKEDISLVVQFQLSRLAVGNSNWQGIFDELQEMSQSDEDRIHSALVAWVFLDDGELAASELFSLLDGSQQDTALALLLAILPNSDARLIDALSQFSSHFGDEANLWNDLLISRVGDKWNGTLPPDIAVWVTEELLVAKESEQVQFETLRQGLKSESEYAYSQTLIMLLHIAVEQENPVLINEVKNRFISFSTHPNFLLAITRMMEGVEEFDAAIELLLHFETPVYYSELARLSEQVNDELSIHAQSWLEAYTVNKEVPWIAYRTERAISAVDPKHKSLIDVYQTLSNLLDNTNQPAKNFYSLFTGHLLKSTGDSESAEKYFSSVFNDSPYANKAFDGLLELYISSHNLEKINAIFDELPNPKPLLYGETLERMREFELAVKVYEEQYDLAKSNGNDSFVRIMAFRLIRCAEYAGLWELAASRLRDTLSDWKDSKGREYLNSKLHWILVEHLAESELALETFTYLHEQNPTDSSILESLARITGEHGDTESAVTYLKQLAVNAQGSKDAAKFYRLIANAYYAVNDIEQSKIALMDSLDLYPEDHQAINALKNIYIDSENYEDLISILTREANLFNDEQRFNCFQQIANIRQTILNQPSLAIDSWSKVLDLKPDNINALRQLVNITDLQSDYESMANYAEALLLLLTGDKKSELQHRLALVYYTELMQDESACALFESVVDDEKYQLEASDALRLIYRKRGTWTKLIKLNQSIAESSDDSESQTNLMKEAVQIAKEQIGDKDLIFELYQSLSSLDANNIESILFCAEYEFQLGRYEQAVEYFERASVSQKERDFDDFDVRLEVANFFYSYGCSLIALERPLKAIEELEIVLELNRSHIPTLRKIGPLLMGEEKFTRAQEIYRQILELTAGQSGSDDIVDSYIALGNIENLKGKYQKAKQRFTKAIEHRSTSMPALIGMSEVMFNLGEWNALFRVYNTIISNSADSGVVTNCYYMKAFVLDKKMGKTEKSVQHHLKSLELSENQPRVFRRLSEIYLRQEKYSDAIQAAGRGIACTEDLKELATLYLLRANAEQYSDNEVFALELFGHALEQNPSLEDALGKELPESERLKSYLFDLLNEAV